MNLSKPANPYETIKKVDHLWCVHDYKKYFINKDKNSIISRIMLHYSNNGTVEITRNKLGKPSVFVDQKPYYVSWSHSYGLLALLVSNDYEVGVDIEYNKPRAFYQKVARRYFNVD